MSAALSSRPCPLLGNRASSVRPLSATTKAATTTQRTNASADAASSFSSRVLASGTTSQGLWLDPSSQAYDILVGQNFVVHRPRRGGPGLVPSPRPPAFARATRTRSGPPARRGGAGSSRFLLLSSSGAGGGDAAAAASSFFDVTEYSVVESSSSPSSSNAVPPVASPPRVFFLGTSGGLSSPGGGAFSSSATANSPSNHNKNPRRTRRLAWTCNLCGGRKVSPVNPLAWEKGSIFIRCGNCDVVHKVKDNLKVFHELAGQVYPIGNSNGGASLPPEAAAAAEAALRKWNQGN